MSITSHELRELGVKSWSDLAEDFKNSDLLLGNGFSLNFSNLFNYRSLFDNFLAECVEEDAQLFRKFETSNFEAIQEQLLTARRVNRLFGISSESIEPKIEILKEGLVRSVQSNHPSSIDIDPDDLDKVSVDIDQFGEVFTLNYDLFLYKIVMFSKDRADTTGTSKRHNDYFWSPYNDQYLEFKDFDIYSNKHVYYLHGALFVFPGHHLNHYSDLKLRKGNDSLQDLIGIVSSEINRGRLPLFVTEGSSEDKMRSISRSTYLTFAYRKLESSTGPLTIYGWSASPQDDHIINAISSQKNRGIRKPIAVSLYVGSKSQSEMTDEINFLKSRLSGHKLEFFDSATLFAV